MNLNLNLQSLNNIVFKYIIIFVKKLLKAFPSMSHVFMDVELQLQHHLLMYNHMSHTIFA